MAISTLITYKTKLTPERNAMVDDLNDYLNTCTTVLSATDLQYQKITLDMTVKLNADQKYADNSYYAGNYAMIYQDGKYYYFFIMGTKWVAQNTVELRLSLDTVNTFKERLNWTDKTTVLREHKNRFTKRGNDYYRNIDIVDEGISPVLYGREEELITQGDSTDSWYLIYKAGETDASPVRCFLTSDNAFSLDVPQTKVFTPANMTNDGYFFINARSVGISYTGSVKLYDASDNLITTINAETWYWYRRLVLVKQNSTTIKVYRFETHDPDYYELGGYPSKSWTCAKVVFEDPRFYYAWHATGWTFETDVSTITSGGTKVDITGSTVRKGCISIDKVNRADPAISKIIKLPYCPVEFSNSVLSGPWTYNTTEKLPELLDLNASFSNNIIIDNPVSETKVSLAPHLTDLKSVSNESKLYNSSYQYNKFVYDSFSYIFAAERYDTTNYTDKVNVEFVQTTTMNSRFMFRFKDYKQLFTTEDYSDILIVSRNNEIPVYNNAYLNYIKNGYNYDVKNMQMQTAVNWAKTGLSLAGAVGGFLLGGTGVGAAAGVALAVNTANQLTTAISSTINSERQLQQKLVELRNQAVSVSGSDDVDLMTVYSGNKAKIKHYSCSDKMIGQLYDLFYLTGYATNENKIPDFNTRSWFNYIKCTPVFDNITTQVYNDYISDIKARFEAGITVYHRNNNTYDWEQQYENWETTILS